MWGLLAEILGNRTRSCWSWFLMPAKHIKTNITEIMVTSMSTMGFGRLTAWSILIILCYFLLSSSETWSGNDGDLITAAAIIAVSGLLLTKHPTWILIYLAVSKTLSRHYNMYISNQLILVALSAAGRLTRVIELHWCDVCSRRNPISYDAFVNDLVILEEG